jgi:hypothetical protein
MDEIVMCMDVRVEWMRLLCVLIIDMFDFPV